MSQELSLTGRNLPSLAPTANSIKARVQLIQEVMKAVMIKNVHYGVIPGTDKPTLLKPGSEVLLSTFQIAPSIRVEDLSTPDCARVRVFVTGVHSPSGMVIGEGIGECSSNETKYKWRKAFDDEWNDTPPDRRRITFGKYRNKQVRTEPADVANTILKMAKKRAQIDMTLTATGASDCFDQDLDETIGDHDDEPKAKPETKPAPKEDARKTYPEKDYGLNFPVWKQRVMDGKATGAAIVALLDSKFVLSESQRGAILALDEDKAKADAAAKDAADAAADQARAEGGAP